MRAPRKDYDIVEFEDWMAQPIAELNVQQYGGTLDEKLDALQRVTGASFAKERGVALAALHEGEVVGVQTYRYWPYQLEGERYYSLQSGGTLVHAEHRGQGLFSRMLRAGNEIIASKGVDFLTGFPVPMSFGGFIKDAWTHVDSPMWYTRALRPVTLLRQRLMARPTETRSGLQAAAWIDIPNLRRPGSRKLANLATDRDFLHYRYGEGRSLPYLVSVYEWGGSSAVVIGKERISNGFSEVILGDLLTSDGSMVTAYRALKQVLRDLRRDGVAACSILLGTGMTHFYPLVARFGFLPVFKKTLYITKPVSERCKPWVSGRWSWNLMYADIDTW